MRTTIIFIALTLLTPWAGANTVTLQGPASVAAGEQFEVAIIGDFGSFGLLAGGLQIQFDHGLASVDDFEFALLVDPSFSCPEGPGCPNDPPGAFSIVWGELAMLLIEPDAGPTLMGTLTMTATQTVDNVTPLVLSMIDLDDLTGGWFTGAVVQIPTPQFSGVAIDIRPVPLPAAAWLLLSALGALAGFRFPGSYHAG